MTAMIISLFGVMVTLIATYTKSDAFTYFGTIISAGGIVFQYFVSKPYVLPFSLADLTKVGERKYELRTPTANTGRAIQTLTSSSCAMTEACAK